MRKQQDFEGFLRYMCVANPDCKTLFCGVNYNTTTNAIPGSYCIHFGPDYSYMMVM